MKCSKIIAFRDFFYNISHLFSVCRGLFQQLRINLIAADIDGQGRKFYVFNGHGDVVQLINSSGQVLDKTGNVAADQTKLTYDYDAFGNEKNINPDDVNPFRYCGEYTDSSSGLIYLQNRYYSPSIGRFITEDPIRDGLNWYTYANNNPIMYSDPSGLSAWLIHGTNLDDNPAPEETWTQEFKDYMKSDILNDGESIFTPRWSGGNDKASREQASKDIAAEIIQHNKNNPDDPIRLVAHSHGGNVAVMVTNILAKEGVKLETLVTAATPVRGYQLDKGVSVGKHVNVYNNADQVQVRGGPVVLQVVANLFSGIQGTSAGRTFKNATNVNAKDAGKWNAPTASHSTMHNSKSIWEKYIAPLFK